MRAEAADGNGTNNANFSTPAADGGAPRMQMYLWPGNQLGAQNQLVIDGGATYGASWARFTPPVPRRRPGRAHARLRRHRLHRVGVPGLAARRELDRGRRRRHARACSYLQRVEIAQSLNADAVVVAHNADRRTRRRSSPGSMIDAPVVIPAVAVNAGRRRGDQGADRRRPGADRPTCA